MNRLGMDRCFRGQTKCSKQAARRATQKTKYYAAVFDLTTLPFESAITHGRNIIEEENVESPRQN